MKYRKFKSCDKAFDFADFQFHHVKVNIFYSQTCSVFKDIIYFNLQNISDLKVFKRDFLNALEINIFIKTCILTLTFNTIRYSISLNIKIIPVLKCVFK